MANTICFFSAFSFQQHNSELTARLLSVSQVIPMVSTEMICPVDGNECTFDDMEQYTAEHHGITECFYTRRFSTSYRSPQYIYAVNHKG